MTLKLRLFVGRYCLPLFMLVIAAVVSGCLATGPQGPGFGSLQPALPKVATCLLYTSPSPRDRG